jgi:ERCC4-type nuclease
MLLLDDRAGSKELYNPLLAMDKSPQVLLTTLEAGDVAFMGEGPRGDWLSVGIEYKTVNDVLACIRDSRFVDVQLRGMLQLYEVLYLIVEGRYSERKKDGGLFVAGRRNAKSHTGISFSALMNWLTTMEQVGVHLRQTDDRLESAAVIVALYNWWQKPYSGHHSLKGVHEAPSMTLPSESPGIQLMRHEPSFTERALAQVEGVGYLTAADIAKQFPSVDALLRADQKQIMEVPGVGPVLASRIYGSLRGMQGVE